jgi:Zn finger protein HypA/HybF involved in hydrogenase expression
VGADTTSGCAETIVDLPGFVVLAAGEYGGELKLLVETEPVVVHCAQCGARRPTSGANTCCEVSRSRRATVVVWWKRIWRSRGESTGDG